MGWSHNWQRTADLPLEQFSAASHACRLIADALSLSLAGPDGTGTPTFTDDVIEFNGSAPASCEPFCFRRTEHDRRGRDVVWSFCKTQRLPYDLMVQSALIILKHYFGDSITVGSDGNDDDWGNARAVVSEHLGYGIDFVLASTNQ